MADTWIFGCYHDIYKYMPDSGYKSIYSPAHKLLKLHEGKIRNKIFFFNSWASLLFLFVL